MRFREIIQQATRSQEYWDLGGMDPDDGTPPLHQLEADLEAALGEVRALIHHVHDWDEDQWCSVCGADGLA